MVGRMPRGRKNTSKTFTIEAENGLTRRSTTLLTIGTCGLQVSTHGFKRNQVGRVGYVRIAGMENVNALPFSSALFGASRTSASSRTAFRSHPLSRMFTALQRIPILH